MRKYLLSFILLVAAGLPLLAGSPSSSLVFTAHMSGDQENPAVVSDGQGVAIVSLDQSQTTLYVNVSLSHLSSPIVGAHIHEGAPGENGGVIFNLTPFLSGNRIKGALRDISREALSTLLNGNYYINVHTENNPSGEIRGQLSLETDYRYTALMNGNSENPEVITEARGLGIFQLIQNETKVNFNVIFSGLSSPLSGAHIHQAQIGMNGPVVFDLGSFVQGNTIEGTWEPDSALLVALKAGELYINVHTDDNPSGEIRGQIFLLPGITFDLNLGGGQEIPNVSTPGKGLGIVTIWPELNEFEYYVVYDSLSGPATGAHFHLADAGTNGPVLIDITDGINPNWISGSAPLTRDLMNSLLNAGLYVNLHTASHPSGEIRGQVQKFAREAYTFEINGGQESPAVTTPATGAGVVTIDREELSAHYMVVYSNLDGNFTASHFHNAGPGINGGVIYDLTDSYNAFGGAFGYWDETSTTPFTYAGEFQNNKVYLNVHSDMHPSGEIRGNIIRSSTLFTDLPFDPGFGDDLMLTAVLTGDDEVPPVTTGAAGLATLYFGADKTQAKMNITATGLSGPITGVHIHEADPGTNGPVLIPLSNVGNRIQQDITDLSGLDLISLMNGATYVNIHTAENPSGEIRGQLYLEQDYTFAATLSGDQENPEVTTAALGLASIHWTLGATTLDVNVQLTGLESDITGAHFHKGDLGMNGPVIVDLSDLIVGNTLRGTVEITLQNLFDILSGNVYINVHTTDNPSGEIRGQLNYLPGITFDGWMSPLQENPFTTSEASGLALATVYPSLNDIAVWMLVDKVTGPVGSAHLHHAPLLANGGVVHDLSGDLAGNGLIHLGVIDDALLSNLLSGEIYINAHTPAFPSGELRGQLYRLSRGSYGFDLCTDQETDAINAPGAVGSGLVSVDRLHSNLNISVVTDGLTGDLTQSHIHQAGIGVNGPVIADLTAFYQGTNNMFLYGAEADTAIIEAILDGDTYINVHTDANPAGEIRGQIVKENLCSIEVGLDPLAPLVADVQLSPVPVLDQLQVSIDMLMPSRLDMKIMDLAGKQLSAQTFDLFAGANTVWLPTETLLPGFYVLVLSDGTAAQAYKFVK